MLNFRIAFTSFVAAITLAGAVHAQSSSDAPPPTTNATTDLAEGEIRKVDKENKKLTIKHGPLRNLDMPGMTMVFVVNDEAVLDKVRVGERVRFKAEKLNGAITVTRIETVR